MYLTHREQDGRALSHFFLVRVHFSQARWARSWSSSIGDWEPRKDAALGFLTISQSFWDQ